MGETDMQAQAGHWVVRMNEPDCTETERAACRRWRTQSAAHDQAFRNVETIWNRSASLGSDPAIAAALHAAERRKAPQPRRRSARWWSLAAAASVVLCVALLSSGVFRPEVAVSVYETALGEQRHVDLPDGSQVVLDTATTIEARYSKKERNIVLKAGQAQFTVSHDPARPFVVQAAGGRVTAVGTQFQVRVDGADAQATVTLLEGAVTVAGPAHGTSPRPEARLSPGQQLRFDRAGDEWRTDTVDLGAASAWTEGHLFATDWPLDRLVAEMNRYSALKLRLADPSLAKLHISGGFRADDPQSLALVLEHSLPVHATQANGEIVLTRQTSVHRR